MFLDRYYFILVIPAMLIALWAQFKMKSTFSYYSRVRSSLTGAQMARQILDRHGLTDVRVERVSGDLTDHFDPRENVVRLSDSVYGQSTVSAIGVAAHETGHAIQYAEGYGPIRLRAAIIPATQIGSTLSVPLILLGFFMSFDPLVNIGLILFASVTVFQLITLPVEFNASRRAVAVIEGSGMFSQDETDGVRRVLTAAALTYVAALIVAAANLLRMVLLFGRRNND